MRRIREVTRQTPPKGWANVWTLCAMAHIRSRTLRQWIEDGLVDRPAVHGYNSFYSPRAVLQVRAIAHLRASGMRLREVIPRVRGASDVALNALLPAPEAPPEPAATNTHAEAPARELVGERWVIVSLMAGLQLMVRADATDFVQRAAAEITTRYRIE